MPVRPGPGWSTCRDCFLRSSFHRLGIVVSFVGGDSRRVAGFFPGSSRGFPAGSRPATWSLLIGDRTYAADDLLDFSLIIDGRPALYWRVIAVAEILGRCRPATSLGDRIHGEIDRLGQPRSNGRLEMAAALRGAAGPAGLSHHRGDEIGHLEPLPLSHPASRARSGVAS